jgi:hypothetical protein
MNSWRKSSKLSSTGWTDSLVGLSVGLSGGLNKRNREQRVAHAEAPDEPTVVAAVHPTAVCLLAVRFLPWSLQHWMNRRLREEKSMQASEDMCQRDATASWRGGAPDEPTVVKKGPSVHLMVQVFTAFANGSLDTLCYLYPLHSLIWSGWIVWKCREVWDTYKIIYKP